MLAVSSIEQRVVPMSVMEVPTIDRRAAIDLDSPVYEVLNGEIVELPPMSFYANRIASRLVGMMWPHADTNRLVRSSAKSSSACRSKRTGIGIAARTLPSFRTSVGRAGSRCPIGTTPGT